MDKSFITLFDQFSLLVEENHIVDNRIVPLQIQDTGRTAKSTLITKDYEHYVIEALYWDHKIRIVDGIYIYYLHEVIAGFLSNQLIQDNVYFIFNETHSFGVKLYYFKKGNQPLLNIEIYDLDTHSFSISKSFSKIDCRIIIKVFNHYMRLGEIKAFYNEETIVCNFGHQTFKEKR